MATDRTNVFISHIHEDDKGVADLKDLCKKHHLEARNYSITSDKFNRAKSEDYIKGQILGPRIRQCSVLVVYISPETKDSAYVNWEIEYAHKEGKRIVGVWERGDAQCEVPDALKNHADAVVGWQGSNITDAISGRLNQWTDLHGRPRDKRSPVRHDCG